MTAVDCQTFIDTVFRRETDGVVCLALPLDRGFAHYAYTKGILRRIQNRPDSWYVCVSTIKRQAPLRRRKTDCVTAYALMLDDIGTKAKEPPVDLSVKLETSKGNYQGLYLLEPYSLATPENVAYYEACQRAVADAGWSDSGATGVNRLFRIPGSLNKKGTGKKYKTRVVEWRPEQIYTLGELVDALGLKPVVNKTHNNAFGQAIPDDTVLQDPVLEWLRENDRLLSEEASGGWYQIRCPWAEGHSDGRVEAGYSPLNAGDAPLMRGFKCLHDHCSLHNTIQFLAWVQENGGGTYEVVGLRELEKKRIEQITRTLTSEERIQYMYAGLPEPARELLPDVETTAKGVPHKIQLATRANVKYIVDTFDMRARFNMLTREVELFFQQEYLNALGIEQKPIMRAVLDTTKKTGIAKEADVFDIIYEIARLDTYHPMLDWICEREWDGVSRLDDILDTVRVDDKYKQIWRVYLRKWLIQCVQAVGGWENPQPMDSVLLLQGKQGHLKTSWLESLVPKEFFKRGHILSLTTTQAKDSLIIATAKPICELGELDTTFKQSDAGALKAFLSEHSDVYRKPYGRDFITYPRCTAFCATVNRADFLVDVTGSRRFWCVSVEECNPFHDVDIQQLWAEAHTWWMSGEPWYLGRGSEAEREKQAVHFRAINEAEELAETWFEEHDDSATQPMRRTDFTRVLGIANSNVNLSTVRRVLEKHLGAPRQIRHIRNAWAVPTHRVGVKHLKAVDGFEQLKEVNK